MVRASVHVSVLLQVTGTHHINGLCSCTFGLHDNLSASLPSHLDGSICTTCA